MFVSWQYVGCLNIFTHHLALMLIQFSSKRTERHTYVFTYIYYVPYSAYIHICVHKNAYVWQVFGYQVFCWQIYAENFQFWQSF